MYNIYIYKHSIYKSLLLLNAVPVLKAVPKAIGGARSLPFLSMCTNDKYVIIIRSIIISR